MKMTSPDEERLEKIFQELEFRALTDKIIKKLKIRRKTTICSSICLANLRPRAKASQKMRVFWASKRPPTITNLLNQKKKHEKYVIIS